ncbi:hypothetical protein M5689_018797 [Euphorbia peplus]|nr:hypothetical protein M5689_018797 [Euphorbia peplus]
MEEAPDELEEQQINSLLAMIDYKQKVARYYNQKVKARYFSIGDLVLRHAKSSQSPLANGKLGKLGRPIQNRSRPQERSIPIPYLGGNPLDQHLECQNAPSLLPIERSRFESSLPHFCKILL